MRWTGCTRCGFVSFHDYFSDHSKLYASARPTYPEELFGFVASIAPARERVWDCATGNGQAAVGLARYFAEVEATAEVGARHPEDGG